jgi:glycosyltransferase involved in cell wall biosynthesis
MPAYNAAAYIDRAIQSVLAQTFTRFELLVIDDGSTDSTAEKVKAFIDPRIRLIETKHSGIAGALNAGLHASLADLIARFDADDICYPQRLHSQYTFMEENPGHVICGTEADYLDAEGNYVFHYAPPAHEDEGIRKVNERFCPFIHSSVMFRKASVMECGGYNELAKTFEDHFLWSALIKKGKAANLRQTLIQVRLNPSSITIDERWRPQRFIRIREQALENQHITKEEAGELEQIIEDQKKNGAGTGAYHSLVAKKYLWDNYQPEKARAHLANAVSSDPFRISNHLLRLLSYLPAPVIRRLYKLSPHASHNSA